ncbi:MAG: CopG family transcriptional regulator [Methanobacteriota archaeon]|nr:MAG: CopG family transcriptional regulator [Euryarchaeota archaeon]
MGEKFDTIRLPRELVEKVRRRAKATGFGSVEEYVRFVLEEVVREEEGEADVMSEEEEESVKARLRSLGYLD